MSYKTPFGIVGTGSGGTGKDGKPGRGVSSIQTVDGNDGSTTLTFNMSDNTVEGPFQNTLISDTLIDLNKLELSGSQFVDKLSVKNASEEVALQVDTTNKKTNIHDLTIQDYDNNSQGLRLYGNLIVFKDPVGNEIQLQQIGETELDINASVLTQTTIAGIEEPILKLFESDISAFKVRQQVSIISSEIGDPVFNGGVSTLLNSEGVAFAFQCSDPGGAVATHIVNTVTTYPTFANFASSLKAFMETECPGLTIDFTQDLGGFVSINGSLGGTLTTQMLFLSDDFADELGFSAGSYPRINGGPGFGDVLPLQFTDVSPLSITGDVSRDFSGGAFVMDVKADRLQCSKGSSMIFKTASVELPAVETSSLSSLSNLNCQADGNLNMTASSGDVSINTFTGTKIRFTLFTQEYFSITRDGINPENIDMNGQVTFNPPNITPPSGILFNAYGLFNIGNNVVRSYRDTEVYINSINAFVVAKAETLIPTRDHLVVDTVASTTTIRGNLQVKEYDNPLDQNIFSVDPSGGFVNVNSARLDIVANLGDTGNYGIYVQSNNTFPLFSSDTANRQNIFRGTEFLVEDDNGAEALRVDGTTGITYANVYKQSAVVYINEFGGTVPDPTTCVANSWINLNLTNIVTVDDLEGSFTVVGGKIQYNGTNNKRFRMSYAICGTGDSNNTNVKYVLSKNSSAYPTILTNPQMVPSSLACVFFDVAGDKYCVSPSSTVALQTGDQISIAIKPDGAMVLTPTSIEISVTEL